MCIPTPNPPFYFSRKRFYKRSSSSLLQEVERGTVGGGEQGALPSGPLDITGSVATANKQDPAEHAPLGAEEKVRLLIFK